MQTVLVFVIVNILATLAATNNNCENCPEDCVSFYECPEALRVKKIRSPFDERVNELFRASLCDTSGKEVKIFCNGFTKNYADVFGSTTDPLPPTDQCGNYNPSKKIIGGEQADIEDFPWMALIRAKNKTGHVNIICGGSLITEKYVLTAAHCLDLNDRAKKFKGELHSVVLGEYDTSTDKDCLDEDDCTDPVQEYSIHSYKTYHTNTENERNDIGLVRLNGTANLSSDFVKLICLPPADFSPLKTDELLWISGWGRWGLGSNQTHSPIKLKARISYLTREDCQERIHIFPQSSEICAGSHNGTDACRGDSGGPLMVERVHKSDTKLFLVGIVSLGVQCGSRAGIYTNVFEFRDWIVENIKN